MASPDISKDGGSVARNRILSMLLGADANLHRVCIDDYVNAQMGLIMYSLKPSVAG